MHGEGTLRALLLFLPFSKPAHLSENVLFWHCDPRAVSAHTLPLAGKVKNKTIPAALPLIQHPACPCSEIQATRESLTAYRLGKSLLI